jgi:hypothetical protein
METQFTVWAIIFTEKDLPIPSDLWDWTMGSALFVNRDKASAYATELNEADAIYVHSIIELHVF